MLEGIMIVVTRSKTSRRHFILICYMLIIVLVVHVCVHTYITTRQLAVLESCNNNNNNTNNSITPTGCTIVHTVRNRKSPSRAVVSNKSANRAVVRSKSPNRAVVLIPNRAGVVKGRRTKTAETARNDTGFSVHAQRAVSRYLAEHERRCRERIVKHVNDYTGRDLCDCVPSTLLHRTNLTTYRNDTLDAIKRENSDVMLGGSWQPTSCLPRMRVAVVVPFRNRESHLIVLLRHLHAMLQGQLLCYVIVVVEQNSPALFNKAVLMNAGYRHVMQSFTPDCVVFHDVDMIPEDGRLMYQCQKQPLHMAAYHSKHNYRLLYPGMFGGVVALSPSVFEAVNGFSNRFWGWGGEDDDMSYRLTSMNYHIERPPRPVADYLTLPHRRDAGNQQKNRKRMLRTLLKDYHPKTDGLNSLCYSIRTTKHLALYTWLLVDIAPDITVRMP